MGVPCTGIDRSHNPSRHRATGWQRCRQRLPTHVQSVRTTPSSLSHLGRALPISAVAVDEAGCCCSAAANCGSAWLEVTLDTMPLLQEAA